MPNLDFLSAVLRYTVVATCLQLLSGCGNDDSKHSGPALPDGNYSIGAPVCSNTNEAPSYTSPVQPAFLRDYVNTDSAVLTLSGSTVTAIINDADCQLTNGQKVFDNSGSKITFAQYSTHQWSPEGCKLTVAVKGEETEVDMNMMTDDGSKKVYQDNTEANQGGTFEVVNAGNEYTLTLGIALSDFGCTSGGKFRWKWTKT